MTIRRGYADTPLGQLHYAETGTGPTLLLLHQTPRSWDEFRAVAGLIDGYRIVMPDLPGYGASPSLPSLRYSSPRSSFSI